MEQESWKMDKEEIGRQPPEGPILCSNNCGFFGSATTMNLCSQCYRDVVMKETKAAAAMPGKQTLESGQVAVAPEVCNRTDGSTSSAEQSNPLGPPSQPNRCFTCKKCVGLTGFKCKCGNQFCSLHRYHDRHNCSFDYRAAARDALAKANPAVKAEKMDKI
ncbi:hypothetical protein GOP47_0009070 [Adiantum capillus-veneris]|uniref:Uncharacterized protein n=1 Tax=Adiantum capillus-veneris TaxID=13818 RepID=A0A9D4ZLB3_ADICA|nr:hypothetical protein GOP47_0009070 [Adiantum capillus-veneris]